MKKYPTNNRAMTLMEILIVVSMVALLAIALFNSLSNGVRVWDRSRRMVIEEDISIFFDKITHDLQNAYKYSKIEFEGTEMKFSFPTIIRTAADKRSDFPEGEFVDQLGKVEYSFDMLSRGILRRQANYSQALGQRYQDGRVLVGSIKSLKFKYFYRTDDGEISSREAFEQFPSAVDIEVEFADEHGKRVMRKFIDIPVGI